MLTIGKVEAENVTRIHFATSLFSVGLKLLQSFLPHTTRESLGLIVSVLRKAIEPYCFDWLRAQVLSEVSDDSSQG